MTNMCSYNVQDQGRLLVITGIILCAISSRSWGQITPSSSVPMTDVNTNHNGQRIKSIQVYNGKDWINMPYMYPVAIGKSRQFKAVKALSDKPWPTGSPLWGGTSGASGIGSSISVKFKSSSQFKTDYKTVTATAINMKTAKVIVFKVVLKRNSTWSSEDSLPNSLPIKQYFNGEAPALGGPQEAWSGQWDGDNKVMAMTYVVEIQGNVVPSGLNLGLDKFGIYQEYTLTETEEYSDKPTVVGQPEHHIDVNNGYAPTLLLDQDDPSGDIYFFYDNPGVGKDAVEQPFVDKPTMKSYSIKFEFDTWPVYKDVQFGKPLQWSFVLKATKNNNNSIVWSLG